MALVLKKPVTQEQFEQETTTECIEIWRCSRTRACSWIGLHQQLVEGKKRGYETALCCPNCGNEEFVTEYEPKWKAVGSWVIQTKH